MSFKLDIDISRFKKLFIEVNGKIISPTYQFQRCTYLFLSLFQKIYGGVGREIEFLSSQKGNNAQSNTRNRCHAYVYTYTSIQIVFKSKQKKFDGDLKTKSCGKKLYLTKSVKYLGGS